MALNPYALSKCYDCIVTGNCMNQCCIIYPPLDGIYVDDSAFQLAVPCTDRRTGANHALQTWRIKNQRCIESGGSEFPASTVTGDGFDPQDGDVTYTGPFY